MKNYIHKIIIIAILLVAILVWIISLFKPDVVTLNTNEISDWHVGQTGNYTAYINGKKVDNLKMTWSSDNADVATCIDGCLVAVGIGNATITCMNKNGAYATCTVTVLEDIVTLNTAQIENWTIGQTGNFAAYVNGKKVNNSEMQWSSDNEEVATCIGGKLVAVGEGMTTITCTNVRGVSATCIVNVIDKVKLNTEKIEDWKIGCTGSFTAYVNDEKVNNSELEWSSDNEEVATCIDGNLTAVGAGTATITCMNEKGYYATCIVTVVEDDSE